MLATSLSPDPKSLHCYFVYSIHVNPPSFVRSLRHFGIAENLRPGDENLRDLKVTSRLQKMRVFLAITGEKAT